MVLLLAALAGAGASVAAGSSRIVLPTKADVAATSAVILQPRAGEVEVSKLPGPVTDRERVQVALAPGGDVDSIVVDQTLEIHGVGDFDVIMPGPATHIVGPADQAIQPGLRRGEILWNGFSPGVRTVAATITLDPAFEHFRIPLSFSVRFLRNGVPVKPPVTGPVEVEIRISNTTARLITLTDAVPLPGELASLLDGLRAAVAAGKRPAAGTGGIPASLAAASRIATKVQPVQIPLALAGTVRFDKGSLRGASATGASIDATASAPVVNIGAVLPSAADTDGSLVVRIRGTAERLGAPTIDVRADPAVPDPGALTPPGGGSWSRVLSGLDESGLRAGLLRAENALWQVLLLPQIDAYVGNPGTGSSKTVYRFVSAAPSAIVRPLPKERFRPAALALVLVAAALAIGNAAVLWLKS